jgi:hypothetical protein
LPTEPTPQKKEQQLNPTFSPDQLSNLLSPPVPSSLLTLPTAPSIRSLSFFGATCYYFAESLTDLMKAENPNDVVPIGLVQTAVGGSMIEEWLPETELAKCYKSDVAAHNSVLWKDNTEPFLSMSLKG